MSWPSGAFVRVDRLDDEAQAGIERSAEFAAAIGSPVLTIHLFVPVDRDEFRAAGPLDEAEIERFLRFYADACLERGVKPLIENTPAGAAHAGRTASTSRRSAATGRTCCAGASGCRSSASRSTPRTRASSAPSPPPTRPRSASPPTRSWSWSATSRSSAPAAEVAHVSDASGLLGEGLPYGSGELELDPVVRRLAELVPFIVAEINEPDHSVSPRDEGGLPGDRAGARGVRRAAAPRPGGPAAADDFDWQAVVEPARPDPLGGRARRSCSRAATS